MKNYLFDSDKEDTEDEASLRNRLERMGFGNSGYVTSIKRMNECKHEFIEEPNPSSYTTHLICSKCRCSRSAI